ncbi:MAG: hypothetical protein HQK50_06920 [Oligoflexia bacterium]|nr:hypothetical protein [Oligoflexia bacterium]MBF0365286.1 hypothetical protein [Oligoflexia bacterium]
MNILNSLRQNNLSFKLVPIHIRELIYFQEVPCDIYGYVNEFFVVVMQKGLLINKDSLQQVINLGADQLFVLDDDYKLLVKKNQKILLEISRSLSIGDVIANGKKQVYYLSLNLEYLYQNPTDDETLLLQYQCIKSLGRLLLAKLSLIPVLFQYLLDQTYHYSVSQPLLSSLILLGYLKSTQQFSEKDIISLFLTSYFKDIGLSIIPKTCLDKKDLNEEEKKLISQHQQFSIEILSGRIPLGVNYFNIINNHHVHSLLGGDVVTKANDQNEVLIGAETLFVEMVDILAAMISKRPYRDGLTLYSGLQRIKDILGKEHQQEFKLLVWFLQKFFKLDDKSS